MAIHEECGVFGIIRPEPSDVGRIVYYGLYALQHRGQESCGIVVNDDGVFASHKDLGLVGEVFSRDALERLPRGTMAVGHTRYGTTGASSRRNCQPIVVNHQKGHMALAHNGNLSNAARLRSELELKGAIFHTTSDTETIAYIATRERLTAPSIEDALSAAMKHLEGAYSLVLMSPQKLICARDPHGFRPLCYGKLPGGGYVAASESCALTAVGAEFVRDLEPGEILIFQGDTVTSRREHCGKCSAAHCVFEYAAQYAQGARCEVVFVHYRTADEAPFPVPFQDCYTALRWVWAHSGELGIDREHIAVGGDSAGGALAAACALRARDEGELWLCFQLLVYPVTDSRMETRSMKKFTDSPMWNAKLNRRMWALYLRDGDHGMPQYAAPMLAGNFVGLSPAYVEVEEFDCLHDEGIAYAQALSAAGVSVQLEDMKGTFHGFDSFWKADISRTAVEKRIEALRRGFRSPNKFEN